MIYFYLLGKFLVVHLPRGVCYCLASFIADIKFYFFKKDKNTLIFNLYPIVKNKKTARRYARRVLKNFAYYLVDFLRFTKLDEQFFKQYFKVEGLHYFKELALDRKKIVSLTAHLGNYELAATILSYFGYRKICGIALPHHDKRVNAFFNQQRNLNGVEVIATGISIKKCFKALEDRKLIGLLGDRDFSGKGRVATMFGRKCLLPRGTSFIAYKTESHILPCFLVREKNRNYYKIMFEEPIAPYENGRKKSEDEIFQESRAVLEKYISLYPEQWYMFEHFWIS
jgi:KDO2-lipid IV(A) lauroyltransferase